MASFLDHLSALQDPFSANLAGATVINQPFHDLNPEDEIVLALCLYDEGDDYLA